MTFNELMDTMIEDITNRVIERISNNNSTWLNNIQYKVKAEHIEGKIKLTQLDGFEDEVEDIAERVMGEVKDIATEAGADAAKEVLNEATFEITVNT